MQSLTVPGKLESLGAIAEFVQSAASQAGLSKKTAYNLRLAVDEIATNVVVHGYQEAQMEGEVTVTADVDDQRLTIALEDTAGPFDPTDSRTPAQEALERPLEERPVGGLGVYLALSSVDEFVYERVGERNRNIFIMRREPGIQEPSA
jgi:anti-sigma regulatory factor (Ser/Thr protein kinase)